MTEQDQILDSIGRAAEIAKNVAATAAIIWKIFERTGTAGDLDERRSPRPHSSSPKARVRPGGNSPS